MRAKKGHKPVNIGSLLGKASRPSCPWCGSTRVILKGKNRLACKKCSKTFVNPTARKRATIPKGGK